MLLTRDPDRYWNVGFRWVLGTWISINDKESGWVLRVYHSLT